MVTAIKETHVNATENHLISEWEVCDDLWTDDRGKLFRDMQKEYGRCIGKMYIDKKDGSTQEVGYVFRKREKYTDADETYLHETWVEFIT